jgi:hypothetical protein
MDRKSKSAGDGGKRLYRRILHRFEQLLVLL